MSDDFDGLDEDPVEGDGTVRVTLSEAIPSIQDMLHECFSELSAVRHQLRWQEPPEELEVDDSELERPAVRPREIAARLETAAKALRHASGETGSADTPAD